MNKHPSALDAVRTSMEPAIFLYSHTHKVFVNGTEIHLTPMEYSLLEMLVRNRGLAMSRCQLLESVWGCDFVGGSRTVDIHISHLRAKLGLKKEIETVVKYGYRLTGQRVQLQKAAEDSH